MMLRAKCCVKADDLQKEAHMLFYMGVVYENKGNYKKVASFDKSTSFFKAFFNIANKLQDKIGMGFALNRVSCGQYYCGNYEDAIHQNTRCTELMDKDNVYATYYNSGIFLRKLGKCSAALGEFQKVLSNKQALDWALNREDEESECLVLGQIALTYHLKGNDDTALEFYERCREKSQKVDNPKLALDSLVSSLRIREHESITTKNRSKAPLPQEYHEVLSTAKAIGEDTIADHCKISMAVMQGDKQFTEFVRKSKISFKE